MPGPKTPQNKKKLDEYKNTRVLAQRLINQYPERFPNATPDKMVDMLQKIATVETWDKNIVQKGGGPGRGNFQIENTSAPVAYQRYQNYQKILSGKDKKPLPNIKLKVVEDAVKVDGVPTDTANVMSLTKDQQAMLTLSNMSGAARARKGIIDVAQPENMWTTYHWAGPEDQLAERQKQWENVMESLKPSPKPVPKSKAPLPQKKAEGGWVYPTNTAYPRQKAKEGLETGFKSYASDPEYFDSHAVYHDNSKANDQIRKLVYAGTHEYNPETGELRRLKTPVSVSKETQKLATQKGSTPTSELFESSPELRKKYIESSTEEAYKNPLMYAPGTIGLTMLPGGFQAAYGLGSGLANMGAGNIKTGALEAGLAMLPFAPKAIGSAKQIYNTVATGESALPIAWKSPAVGLSNEASERMFGALSKNRNFTDAERAVTTDYQNFSRFYTGRDGFIDPARRQSLFNVMDQHTLNIDPNANVIATRRFNPNNNSLGAEFSGRRLNFGERPTSFSAGVGNDYGSGAVDRVVIPSRYVKQMKDKFLLQEYSPISQETIDMLPEQAKKFAKSIGKTNERLPNERELIGRDLDFTKLGKVKNDIGGYDYIVKPGKAASNKQAKGGKVTWQIID